MSTGPAKRNRRVLLGLIAIAAVPLLAAYILYYAQRGDMPWATTNNGELLAPPLRLDRLGIEDLAGGRPVSARVWWLLTISDGDCSDKACAGALDQQRRLHTLLNKDMHRVRRGLVFLSAALPDRIAELEQAYPELELMKGHPTPLRPGVFVADPLGNVVLYYQFGQAGPALLDDLKKLLKVSQIG